ncbi:MAG: porin, partial [Cyanobacteriota bacterium]
MTFKLLWQSWLLSPAILGATLLASAAVLAQDGTVDAQVASKVSETPGETTATQPARDESTIATAMPMMATDYQNQSENSVV